MDPFSSDSDGEYDTRQNYEKLHQKEMRELDKKRKNWGKNRDAYYNSDTQFFEVGEDEENIRAEEIEVKRIQQEQAQLLAKMDMGLDAILGTGGQTTHTGKGKKGDSTDATAKGTMLSVEQRVKHVLTVSPELLGLLSNFLSYTQELTNILPLLLTNVVKLKELVNTTPIISLIKLRQQLLLAYCTSILYYLYLKTMGKQTTDHPVVLKLVQIQTLLEKQGEAYTQCRDKLLHTAEFIQQADEYTDAVARVAEIEQYKIEKQQQKQQQQQAVAAAKNKKRNNTNLAQLKGLDLPADFDPTEYYNSFVEKRDKNKKARQEVYTVAPKKVDISSTILDADARRGTGMKILLNTGLRKQKSKKQITNAHTRGKLRSKHKEAVIKRRSTVREYKGQQGTDYTGDGIIKKGLIRSKKL